MKKLFDILDVIIYTLIAIVAIELITMTFAFLVMIAKCIIF